MVFIERSRRSKPEWRRLAAAAAMDRFERELMAGERTQGAARLEDAAAAIIARGAAVLEMGDPSATAAILPGLAAAFTA